jgi:hypothetical protein
MSRSPTDALADVFRDVADFVQERLRPTKVNPWFPVHEDVGKFGFDDVPKTSNIPFPTKFRKPTKLDARPSVHTEEAPPDVKVPHV